MKKNEVYGRSVPINFNPLFRVMKLCLLFTVMLNLSVVAATNAQLKKVSLIMENAELRQVFKKIKIGNNQELKVVLESAAESLDEVIVTGYQTISKERTTGSFGVITPRNIETKLQSNLSSVLEGQATGVVLDKDGKIEIRGVSTFNAENEPLVVLDGYPIEGARID